MVDAWEKLGNPGWNWSALKPYYAKAYTMKSLEPELNEHFGIQWTNESDATKSGPIQTSYTGNLADPIPKAWIDTFRNLGYHMTGDPFSGTPMGAFSSLSSIDPVTKERSYAASAYYVTVKERPNLHLSTGSIVEMILFEENKAKLRANGVRFQHNGETVTAKARREIILAAGSLQSPKVLELSGVGDAKLLHSLEIDVKIDNPYVGENLQDHILCSIGFEAIDDVSTLDDFIRQDPLAIEMAMREYMTAKTGPFASVGVTSYAYLPVVEFLSDDGRGTLQKLLDRYEEASKTANPAAGLYYSIARSILESKDEASGGFLAVPTQTLPPADPDSQDPPAEPLAGKFITLGAMLSQPFSRGSVHIASSDSAKEPLIDPKYLTHPLDMEIFARHIRYLETIAASEPLRSLLKAENGRRTGDPKSSSYLTDLEAAKDHVRKRSFSMWHPTSTCTMMPRERGGVVNDRLLVHGTSNLRVVDASIIPLIPRANVQSTVYAVAERAADLIKAEYLAARS